MNTGGPAFPLAASTGDPRDGVYCQSGMSILDWYAGQEMIGDEELSAGICDHFAGPKPTGNWSTNPAGWYEWEARWRAGIKYMRASAMLAEKARREGVVKESSTTDHFPDATKKVELETLNRELAEALNGCVELLEFLPLEYFHKRSGDALLYSDDGALAVAKKTLAKAKEVA